MLRCKSRYRNAALRIYVEAGEVLKEIAPELEEQLLRDSPDSFEVVDLNVKAKALDAPPVNKMMEREKAQRKTGLPEADGHGEVMSSSNMPGLVRPKG